MIRLGVLPNYAHLRLFVSGLRTRIRAVSADDRSGQKKCPECSKLKLRRLIGTGSGVIFKGGGFYETDYRSDSYKKGAEDEKKSSEKKTDDKKASKSTGDSKPDSTKKSSGSTSSDTKKPKTGSSD